MNDFWNGKIAYAPKIPVFSVTELREDIAADEKYKTRFTIQASGGGRLSGFLYSTNPRVSARPVMIEGSSTEIRCSISSHGLLQGEAVDGAFVLVTTQGEYQIPYHFLVRQDEEGIAAQEKVQKLSAGEFAELARTDFGKAYVLFVSKEFPAIVSAWGTGYAALYEGICEAQLTYLSLEQFLTGAGLKPQVKLSLQTAEARLRAEKKTVREELVVARENWGFALLHLESDAEFVEIERPEITTEEFVGSSCHMSYYIHPEKLHAGRNFARVTITGGGSRLEYTVQVETAAEHPLERAVAASERKKKQQAVLQLMKLYREYRLGESTKRDWILNSQRLLALFQEEERPETEAVLLKAALFCEQGREKEALALLGEIEERKEELVLPRQKAVYLYLTARCRKEPSYDEQVWKEIQELQLRNQEEHFLRWMLFRLCPQNHANDSQRMEELRNWYTAGCRSELMYLEAALLVRNEPLLLRRSEAFERGLLAYFCRRDLLTREICGQTAQIAGHEQNFSGLLFWILCRCQETYSSKNLLTALATLMVQGHCREAAYEKWYELAIEGDVRINGLYEYYLETLRDCPDKVLPEAVRLYFRYQNTMDHEHRAALYANVLRNKEKNPQTCDAYRPEMERFVQEMLRTGMMNGDISDLCDALFTESMLTEDMEKAIGDLLFACEVRCTADNIQEVIVVHAPFAGEQRVKLHHGRALVYCYTENCAVLLETAVKERYADPALYEIRPLLQSGIFRKLAEQGTTGTPGRLLHRCENMLEQGEIRQSESALLTELLALPQLRRSYRRSIENYLLTFYDKHRLAEGLEDFLFRLSDEELITEHHRLLIELYAQESMSQKASTLIYRYGYEGIAPAVLLQIASLEISQRANENEEKLLALAAHCVKVNAYNEIVLQYLVRFFEGSLEDMKRVWKAAAGFETDAYALEERILTLLVYLGGLGHVEVKQGEIRQSGMEDTEEIFLSYERHQGRAKLCRGYLILLAYEYFVRERPIQASAAASLTAYVTAGTGAPKICRMAVLRWLAEKQELTPGEIHWRKHLFREAVREGRRFAFYQKLPKRLLSLADLQNRLILEERTDPDASVTLYYRIGEGAWRSQPMHDSLSGIFTAEMTLYYQDRLTWYTEIEINGETEKTSLRTETCTRRSARGASGRYDLINRMIEAQINGDESEWKEAKEQYIGQEYLVDTLFDIV
ncbi:MAG: DUF5717 family protein [Eubacteriales bacterium]|nr:DUF5717 family protein [Eubacteriales bacterium]